MTIKPFTTTDAGRVREFFNASAYDEANIREVQPMGMPPSLRQGDLGDYEERLGAWTAFHCLTKWFFLGCPVSEEECAEVIPAWFSELCEAHGLLERAGGMLEPRVLLTPCEDVWITSDLHRQRQSDDVAEHILPLNRPARHLCQFLIREPRSTGLDLCSGNGLHAVIVSSYCEKVSTADLSPRSVMFSQFNAALNGRRPFQCYTGDCYEPLAGQSFDIIVCNPPFVITPDGEMKYHANAMDLDGFCRQLIQSTPAHLNEGGICQMLCEWVQMPGQAWEERLAAWWEGLGCDVWIILANTQKPETYARTRSLDAELTLEQQRIRQDKWLTYLHERRVRAVHGGIITFRRREKGPHWQRIDRLDNPIEQPAGEAMARIMAAEDFLQSRGNDANLLEWCPRVSPAARLEQESAWSGEGWESLSAILRMTPELTPPLQVDQAILAFLSHCQGENPLGELIGQFAASMGAPPDAISGQILQTVRQLIKRGLLNP